MPELEITTSYNRDVAMGSFSTISWGNDVYGGFKTQQYSLSSHIEYYFWTANVYNSSEQSVVL